MASTTTINVNSLSTHNLNAGNTGFNKNIIAINSLATSLNLSQSGSVVTLSAAGLGSGAVITLPTLTSGCNFTFFNKEDTPSQTITIRAAEASNVVHMVQRDAHASDFSNSTLNTPVRDIILGTSTKQGDVVQINCDGSFWYARVLSSVDNAITTATA